MNIGGPERTALAIRATVWISRHASPVAQNASAAPMESTNRLKCSFAAHFCDVAKVE
jgi:hypothetical protein